MSEVNVIVSKIDKESGTAEGKYFVLDGDNLSRDEFLETIVEKSGYPIRLDELKRNYFHWIMIDHDSACSNGQVIEIGPYNIQFTGIDFDGLNCNVVDDDIFVRIDQYGEEDFDEE